MSLRALLEYRECHEVPIFFSAFFAVPQIEFVAGSDTSDFETSYAAVRNWSLDECATFCVMFLTTLSGSDDINEQLSFIRQFDAPTRRLLRDTTLIDETCIAYCHLRHFSAKIASSASSLQSWNRLLSAATVLAKNLDEYVIFVFAFLYLEVHSRY